MDLLSHYLSYQASPMSAPLINVDHLRELLYRLKYMNLNATREENFENVQVSFTFYVISGEKYTEVEQAVFQSCSVQCNINR